jgi:hypothetical protein
MPERGTSAIEGSSGQSFRKLGIVNVSIEWDYADRRVIVLQNIQRERYAGRGGDGSRVLEMLKSLCNQLAFMSEVRRFVMTRSISLSRQQRRSKRASSLGISATAFLSLGRRPLHPSFGFRGRPRTGASLQRKSRSMATKGSSAGGIG